jgi:hypothetical protein
VDDDDIRVADRPNRGYSVRSADRDQRFSSRMFRVERRGAASFGALLVELLGLRRRGRAVIDENVEALQSWLPSHLGAG